jgi:hypothetical protein
MCLTTNAMKKYISYIYYETICITKRLALKTVQVIPFYASKYKMIRNSIILKSEAWLIVGKKSFVDKKVVLNRVCESVQLAWGATKRTEWVTKFINSMKANYFAMNYLSWCSLLTREFAVRVIREKRCKRLRGMTSAYAEAAKGAQRAQGFTPEPVSCNATHALEIP